MERYSWLLSVISREPMHLVELMGGVIDPHRLGSVRGSDHQHERIFEDLSSFSAKPDVKESPNRAI